jgi:hypothetical protein
VTDGRHERQDGRNAARLRGFKLHLLAYFVAMTVLIPVNLLATPKVPWFVLPMVGWGAILAVHTAWTMGLFDIFSRRK